MQRWFFLEDPNNDLLRRSAGDDQPPVEVCPQREYRPRRWLFRVRVPDLADGLQICVSGSVQELGCWQPEYAKQLTREHAESDIWSAVISIPDKVSINYRFCACVVIEQNIHVIVRHWETNIEPRLITALQVSPMFDDNPLTYGEIVNEVRIDRGWLIKETSIQLKLTKGSITIWRPKYANRSIFMKVTPVSLIQYNSNFPKTMSEALEESLSTDTQDMVELPKHSTTEVASLAVNSTFLPQPQFGMEFKENEMLVFQSTILFPDTTAFLLDFFIYSSRQSEGEPPYHAGFSYLLPSALQGSEGNIVMPITSTKQRPLGELRINYLVVRPMPNVKCDMSLTYARHWKQTRSGLDVGHRGAGNSFKEDMKNCAEVRENTIASLKTAIDHGADFVEFDVQLSKDLVPIIYHDFHVCISMKKKKTLNDMDMLEIPIKDLTFEQLKLLKVYHLSEGKSKHPRFFDEDLEEHQPFPSLQQAFEVLNPHVGFNIEIKWTMQRLDESYELYHPTDLNLYLDTILEVVLKHGGERRIIFSCFNPDICSMIRMKQNKYPVMFLTQGETARWPKYKDPRCWDIRSAVHHATMTEILGVNVHTEDVLRDSSFVKMAKQENLVIFCWGDDNADPVTIKYLKELGMHGVIYDKIDQYSSKEVKESIFLVEARESQKDLLRLAAANAESPTAPPTREIIRERLLDVDRARGCLEDVSTATTLKSLESSIECINKREGKH